LYVVSLFMISGQRRIGKFGCVVGNREHVCDRFNENGDWSGCLRCFQITVPDGQKQTRMFITGKGIYLSRVCISKLDEPLVGKAAGIKRLAGSSYRTVLRGGDGRSAGMVLAPAEGVEARLARKLAGRLNLPVAAEAGLKAPFPAYPPVRGASPETNLILLSAGVGGPLVQALRRAGLIAENLAVPGPGGYVIRTIARPFEGTANVIVISSGDEAGLARGVAAFAPAQDGRQLVYDKFLIDVPSGQWAKLRDFRFRLKDGQKWWDQRMKGLRKPMGGMTGGAPARNYIRETAQAGLWYWRTGNDKFAELFKRMILKMSDEGIYGCQQGNDSHMELYGLIQAWDRVEESPVFTPADRLRITNYLLGDCVEGHEGFARAYSVATEYSSPVRMRHNHQTILGCGLMQAYLYYWRLYRLPRAKLWKAWCDDLILNGTAWGHAPEDSPNYEPRTYMEIADMIHYQGLSTRGQGGTEAWPQTALRFLAARDSFSLPAAYGDCWDNFEYAGMNFLGVMRDDWGWPAAQLAIDRLIRGYRYVHPNSRPAGRLYAYLNGSTDVGGLREPPDKAKAREAVLPLLGLAAVPMTEGYWRYMTGQVGHRDFWAKHGRPEAIAYERTADKVQYRGGWNVNDEYLLLETLGWADHGHMDLGTIVQYCHGGRLWIVDFGYNNTGPQHHSTLEVKRDGKKAWGHYGEKGRWGDFRSGPQMFEILKLDPDKPGKAGPFRVVCRAKNLAGATWVRAVSGGEGQGLIIEDTLTAGKPGEYEAVFRLRLLGDLEGKAGAWVVKQKDAVLPIALKVSEGDGVTAAKWMPDDHARAGGAYPWYPFAPKGGIPKTIEWKRKVALDSGQSTVFRARVGPSAKNP